MSERTVPAVAAFDLDGTLTEGGSVFPWLCRIAGASAAMRAALRLALPLGIGALVSGSSADHAKERLFHALLAGRDVDDVTAISRVFAEQHLRQKSRPLLVARLQWHLGEGHDVVVVSASPQIYVELIAGQLKAHGALGTRLVVDDRNKFTGRYLGQNCRGDEKMRRLGEWIDARAYAATPDIYAYGNSRGDQRLLSGATHPYDVGRLGRLGSLRRFPRLDGGGATAGESWG